MKTFLLLALAAACTAAQAAPVTIVLEAPAYPAQEVVLYRYADLFTQRLERIALGRTDARGHAVITADVDGTQRTLLRIGKVGADLFLRPGQYHVQMPPPGAGTVRTISGAARVDLVFLDLDPLDVNALVSDLNDRLDAFVASDLATDANAGMEAVAKARSGRPAPPPDSLKRPDLYTSPRWSAARTDSFALKLRKFYAGVNDPWFQQEVEYGIAGLGMGPRATDREMFNRYLKDRPIFYDVPEYVRFFQNFFDDHLLRHPFRTDPDLLLAAVKHARIDSLNALLSKNEFLKDARLRELVLLNGLYRQEGNKLFDHDGIVASVRKIAQASPYPENRLVAANMLWDLTAMAPGAELPEVELIDAQGRPTQLNPGLAGTACLLLTTIDNPYSAQELQALEALANEYAPYARFICVALDRTPGSLSAWLAQGRQGPFSWYVPADQQQLLDHWRIRNTPVLFVLEGAQITASPGPLPSQGLGAFLYKLKVKEEQERRLRPDRGTPPPKR